MFSPEQLSNASSHKLLQELETKQQRSVHGIREGQLTTQHRTELGNQVSGRCVSLSINQVSDLQIENFLKTSEDKFRGQVSNAMTKTKFLNQSTVED